MVVTILVRTAETAFLSDEDGLSSHAEIFTSP